MDFCLKRQLLKEREYISKLQVELVEKYQDTLITEKNNKWPTKQESDIEHQVKMK